MVRAGKNTITNLKPVSWARGWTSSDYTPQGCSQTSPWAPDKLPGAPCILILLEESCDQAAGFYLHFPDNSQLPKLPLLARTSSTGTSTWKDTAGLFPRDMDGSCHFWSLKPALNPRPGFLHESFVNPHLLKSSFPIQGEVATTVGGKMSSFCAAGSKSVSVFKSLATKSRAGETWLSHSWQPKCACGCACPGSGAAETELLQISLFLGAINTDKTRLCC